ncbi:MAG: hypothetical protein KC486_05560 [Myxococcales bacterium]|nr:hypothetical protein [Myxococcales bacterium]
MFAGDDADSVHAGPGDDHVKGEGGDDLLRGGPGDDILYGGDDADTLLGNAGDDILHGEAGADTIHPGPGADAAFGGGGDDVFIVGSPCEVSAGDRIDGGSGSDKVQSPLTEAQLTSLGYSFASIETFEIIAYDHSECLVVDQPIGDPTPITPTGGGLFTRLAPRDNGTLLAGTGASVFDISAIGTATLKHSGDAATIAPTAHLYGVTDWSASEFKTYDSAGTLLGTVANVPPATYFKALPTSSHVLRGDVEVTDPETLTAVGFRALYSNGTQRSQVSAPSLGMTRLTPTHVVHTTATTLTKTDLDGNDAWSVTRSIFDLAPSMGATTRFIAIYRADPNHVYHFEENGSATSTTVDGQVWNVAISPDGDHSAATVHQTGQWAPRLYLFTNGQLNDAIELPVVYANSLAVTDQGEIMVGGQDSSDHGLLLFYAANGNLLWQESLGYEKNGYRPKVVASPSGDVIAVAQTLGLSVYSIDRSP